MSPLIAGAIALATDPTPNPTENQLRPGLEEWQVSPGLIGFVVTFALAVACVLLFLNMSKHLRRAGHNAREQGLAVPTPEVIRFRTQDGAAARSDDSKESDGAAVSDSGGSSPDHGGSSSGSSGGSGGDGGSGGSGGDGGSGG